MKSRHTDKPQVEWMVGDVRNMTEIESKSVAVVFDKGTLDAMIYGSPWSPPEEVLENSGRYINEVRLVEAEESKTNANCDKIMRVLEDDGVFLYVTYRQPHFIKPILNRNNEWDLRMEIMGGGDSFQYFGFALKKHASAVS
jgi:hypothetical protein